LAADTSEHADELDMNPTKHSHIAMNVVHTESEQVGPEQLARVDLNLLVAFDALARERNVTRAAARTGVTQSAMSHALGRLRDMLGDPLLVRGRGGMMLTPRAEALVVPLRAGLTSLGRALAEPPVFEPATARRAFRLASPDLFDVLAIPSMLERVRREAPGVDVIVAPLVERGLLDKLEAGELDVAIVPSVDGAPADTSPGLLQRRLFRDRFLCLLRADHPVLKDRDKARPKRRKAQLSLQDFAELSHVLVSPSGGGPGFVDQLLAEHGLRRRIALRIPHFYSALAIVARSDLVVTAPNALGYLAPAELGVVAVECPLPLPEHSVNLVWHERYSKDAGHTWLRQVVIELAREIQRDISR
jgi:DNA-binding transcriptional LysR family regulator